MLKCVVFSERAFTAILSETQENLQTETGGVFLGHRDGDVWYVIESIDPGPKSIFEPTYFEYDRSYIDHLINKVSRLYMPQLDLVGLWHRHPGSFDSFSGTDDGTNKQYAALNDEGAISALVNIDPTFRLTVYAVSLPLKYEKIKYIVGDAYIPIVFRQLRDNDALRRQISNTSSAVSLIPGPGVKGPKSRRSKKAHVGFPLPEAINGAHTFSLSRAIHSFLMLRTHEHSECPFTRLQTDLDADILSILEVIDLDLLFLKQLGIACELSISPDGALHLKEAAKKDPTEPQFEASFGIGQGQALFCFDKCNYRYYPGLFRDAYLELLLKEGETY